jgi:hypothetical protein
MLGRWPLLGHRLLLRLHQGSAAPPHSSSSPSACRPGAAPAHRHAASWLRQRQAATPRPRARRPASGRRGPGKPTTTAAARPPASRAGVPPMASQQPSAPLMPMSSSFMNEFVRRRPRHPWPRVQHGHSVGHAGVRLERSLARSSQRCSARGGRGGSRWTYIQYTHKRLMLRTFMRRASHRNISPSA